MKRIVIFSIIVFFITLFVSGICIEITLERLHTQVRAFHFVMWISGSLLSAIIVFVGTCIIERVGIDRGNTGDDLHRAQ